MEFCPTEPEPLPIKKIKKLAFIKQIENCTVLMLRFQHENSYNHILNKLISIANFLPSTLELVIVAVDTTYLDTNLAQTF